MDVKEELRHIAQEIADLQARLDERATHRDDLILKGLSGGERPTDLGRAAGLSRERIYQIKRQAEEAEMIAKTTPETVHYQINGHIWCGETGRVSVTENRRKVTCHSCLHGEKQPDTRNWLRPGAGEK